MGYFYCHSQAQGFEKVKQFYIFLKVLACHAEEMWCAESHPVTVEMFDTPEKPYALVPGNTSLQLDWEAPSNVNLIRFWFELQKVDYTVHLDANSSFML